VSNIYNNNKAFNAKIGQNVNKAVYFFACFFHVNLVVCLIIFLSVFYLIFVFELFSPGQLQWLFPPMEVIKLQREDLARESCNGSFRPWKSLNFSIQQKVLCDALMMD
jgi:hypothetical protein